MSKQWSRQDIKRNEAAALVDQATVWIQLNRRRALAIGGGTAAVLAVAGLVAFRMVTMRDAAWERLALAQSFAYRGQIPQALDQLKNLSAEFGQTAAAKYGQLFAGDLLFRQGNYKEAADQYRRLAEQGFKDTLPMALAGLGLSLEALGDYKGAAEADQRLLDSYQDHFLAPQAHASLVRSLAALGQNEQARSFLERMALLFPETYWAVWAQARLHPEAAPAAPH